MSTRTKKSTIPAWLVLSDGGAKCLRCGKKETVPIPMPIAAFGPWCEYVGALHGYCKEGQYTEPVPQSVDEWFVGDDTGTSSKAIYRHMKGLPPEVRRGFGNYPHDPEDFGRCYRLLALAPEWRARIGEMAVYGKEWAALASSWDTLTEMYEEEIGPSHRGSAPKLYARMKELTW